MKLPTILITAVVVICILGSALISIFFVEGNAYELKFVFEVVRHGARAPLLGGDIFSVSKEMLTPQGMR
jgi:hypothetical protein